MSLLETVSVLLCITTKDSSWAMDLAFVLLQQILFMHIFDSKSADDTTYTVNLNWSWIQFALITESYVCCLHLVNLAVRFQLEQTRRATNCVVHVIPILVFVRTRRREYRWKYKVQSFSESSTGLVVTSSLFSSCVKSLWFCCASVDMMPLIRQNFIKFTYFTRLTANWVL